MAAIPQRETAARLGVTEATIEKHLAKGVRLLADLLFGTVAKQETRVSEPDFDDELPDAKQHTD